MSTLFNLKSINILYNAIDQYNEIDAGVTPTEFIERKLIHEDTNMNEDIAKLFLNIYKHKTFLELALDNFCNYNIGCSYLNKCNIRKNNYVPILFYIVIFELDIKNMEFIRQLFKEIQKFSIAIMQYFRNEDNLIDIVMTGCKVYDNEYVNETIVNPLVRNVKIVDAIYKDIRLEKTKKHTFSQKLSIPPTPRVLKRPGSKKKVQDSIEAPPPQSFKSRKVPDSTYLVDEALKKSLEEAKNMHRREANELLQQARMMAFRCAEIKLRREPEKKVFKRRIARPAPKPSDVSIKTTTTTIMREAALLAKSKEEEIKKLDDLMSGAYDNWKIESLELEIRKAKQQEHVQEIERKHLQGLITHEEALLAKKKLLQANQEKMEEFQEQRLQLLNELDKWRLEELEKNKALIIKGQMIEKAARESEKRLLKSRQCNAKLIDYENKRLIQAAQRKKEQELAEKMKLIQELRALQQINSCAHFKEFDKTETANLGLFCEMSIAELQERLNLLKVTMKEELDQRKKKIVEEKRKQQEFLDNVKDFITESKKSIVKVKTEKVQLQVTPEIMKLREKLQKAKNLRMGMPA